MRGYLPSRKPASGKLPGVVVIHENRGLNPYIEDVTRRLAVDGFVAFAPDALTPAGGYPGDEERAQAVRLSSIRRGEPRTWSPLRTASSPALTAAARSAR